MNVPMISPVSCWSGFISLHFGIPIPNQTRHHPPLRSPPCNLGMGWDPTVPRKKQQFLQQRCKCDLVNFKVPENSDAVHESCACLVSHQPSLNSEWFFFSQAWWCFSMLYPSLFLLCYVKILPFIFFCVFSIILWYVRSRLFYIDLGHHLVPYSWFESLQCRLASMLWYVCCVPSAYLNLFTAYSIAMENRHFEQVNHLSSK